MYISRQSHDGVDLASGYWSMGIAASRGDRTRKVRKLQSRKDVESTHSVKIVVRAACASASATPLVNSDLILPTLSVKDL